MPTSGDKLKEARIEKGLTLQQLGKLIGVSHATLSKYESGDIENIPPNRIEDLARVLEVSPAYLMGWEDRFIKERNVVKKLIEHTRKKHIDWVAPTNPKYDFPIEVSEFCSEFLMKTDKTYLSDKAFLMGPDHVEKEVKNTSFVAKVIENYYFLYALDGETSLYVLQYNYDGFHQSLKGLRICSNQEVQELNELYNLLSAGSIGNKSSYLNDLLDGLNSLDSPSDDIPF